MKFVAVSQRVDVCHERRDALDQRLTAFLLQAGFMPIPVPNGLCVENAEVISPREIFDAWMAKINPHAILLSGGNNIGSCPERDQVEGWLLDHAQQRGLPVLGICRGMQMMGVRAGASLKPVTGHVHNRHQLAGEINGDANSYHNFSLAQCPLGFGVIAQSEDGEIEAIRNKSLPWEGWMWHPEREKLFAPRDLQRIKCLFNGMC